MLKELTKMSGHKTCITAVVMGGIIVDASVGGDATIV